MGWPQVRTEVLALSGLTGPLLLTGLGYMLLGVVDTAIVGRLGEVALGAVGLGNGLYFAITVLGWGWMLALDPLIAQAVGAGQPERVRHVLWQGLWVALGGALPLMLLVAAAAWALDWMRLAPQTVADTRPYLLARAAGLLPFMGVAGLRSFLQGHEITRPLIASVVIANIVNLPLSYALVFGVPQVGIAGLGAEGAGWASTVATLVQCATLAGAVRRRWGDHRALRWPDLRTMAKILRLGTPIGLQLMAEVGSFAIVSVLMGTLGTRALGAHQIALLLISVTFQLALSLGAATATRVGHAIGRDDTEAARRSGLVGIGMGGAAMVLFAGFFLSVPSALARVFTDDAAVIRSAVPLLAIAAAFQISDGVQVVAAGALRGAGDTRWPLISNVIGHYAVGVPVGAALAFSLGLGGAGLWWGLSAGLTFVAISLSLRFRRITRGRLRRV